MRIFFGVALAITIIISAITGGHVSAVGMINTDNPTVVSDVARTPEPALTVSPTVDPSVLISYIELTNEGLASIELKNTSNNTPVNVASLEVIIYTDAPNSDECVIGGMNGYLLGNQTLGFAHTTTEEQQVNGIYSFSECDVAPVSGQVYYIELHGGNSTIQRFFTLWDENGGAHKLWRGNTTSPQGNQHDFTLQSKSKTSQYSVHGNYLYVPNTTTPLRIIEVAPNPITSCTTLQRQSLDPLCYRYIKIYNDSDATVVLDFLRLRSGNPSTRNSLTYNTSLLSGSVGPNGFAALLIDSDGKDLKIDDSDGTIWFQDVFGVVNYSNTVTPYRDAELVAQQGKSWALDSSDGIWKWAKPSPFTKLNRFFTQEELAHCKEGTIWNEQTGKCDDTNVEDAPKPCNEGWYRFEGTGRCRKIVVVGEGQKPCKEGYYRSEITGRCRKNASTSGNSLKACSSGQYRSPVTNRCRNIVSTSTRKPCSSDQFRNPTTGRCKKIASIEDVALKMCGPGYERNKETNRCRKIKSENIPKAGYVPEKITTQQKDFMGWWAIAGVLVLGVLYGVWEWRFELAKVVSRFVHRS